MDTILTFITSNGPLLLSLLALVAGIFSIVSHKLTKNLVDDKIADAMVEILGKFGVKVPEDTTPPKA